jgi:hypothetical protein
LLAGLLMAVPLASIAAEVGDRAPTVINGAANYARNAAGYLLSPVPLPDSGDGSSSASSKEVTGFGGNLATVGKTIEEDELHILRAPFHKSAIKWDLAMAAATGALIATDEHVMHQVPSHWHNTSVTISDAGVAGVAATAGAFYLSSFLTHSEHARRAGTRTAEAAIDSVGLYASMKAIFARQRPYSGEGEGSFFAGNWSSGSFPSGHSMFAWTIASAVAHEYHSIPLDIAVYGTSLAVTTTRITAAEHFPSDVFVGAVFGYLIGAYVAHKDEQAHHALHSESFLRRAPNAILSHVSFAP